MRHDAEFGLYVDVLATTGARPSQAARLLVEDLHAGAKPRLTMPQVAKGGSKNRAARKASASRCRSRRRWRKLKQAAKGRAAEAPLLLQGDGLVGRLRRLSRGRARDRPARKLDADMVTLYGLRHTSIVRQLLAACRSGSSPRPMTRACQIESTTPSISPITGTNSRAALLHHEPVADNVVARAH